MADVATSITPVMDEDIAWVSDMMGLRGLDDRRKAFLRCLTTVDVSACPGSGKTTLVVAKLALLARRWPWQTRGICVLSHTNAAREEIETKLGPTPVGHRLASYPHYIDTIHGFLGRFLALPWLSSNLRKFQAFDDDLTNRVRRRFMGRDAYKLEFFLSKRGRTIESLRIQDVAYNLGDFPAGADSSMHRLAQGAVRHAAESGFFVFDDILLLATALLMDAPSTTDILCQRFPFVLMDEMQDTDDRQGRLLAAIFPRSREGLCVQRVGDPNQAIFDEGEEAGDDAFPEQGRCLGIPNSFRFGQRIASCAAPLAVEAVGPEGLHGVGPGTDAGFSPQPTIILFPDDAPQSVLPAFGKLVLDTIPDSLLAQGTVAAVGAVHKSVEEIDTSKYPKSVCHYWDDYEPFATQKGDHPATLAEYAQLAQRKAKTEPTFGNPANDMAFGMLHLVRLLAGNQPGGSTRGRPFKRLLDGLDVLDAAVYLDLLLSLLEADAPLSRTSWATFAPRLQELARKLGGEASLTADARSFLAWPERLSKEPAMPVPHASVDLRNIYRHQAGSRSVDIRLGSIHSVKGQTHLATLVLEVFLYRFFLASLLTRIQNAPLPKKGLGKLDKRHQRLAYVAMTRPTHLLCLAMRASSLGEGAKAGQNRRDLEAQGWQLVWVKQDS